MDLWFHLSCRVSDQFLILPTMDVDGDTSCDDTRELRGFRRRWNAPQEPSSEQSGPLEQALHEESSLHADGGTGDALFVWI